MNHSSILSVRVQPPEEILNVNISTWAGSVLTIPKNSFFALKGRLWLDDGCEWSLDLLGNGIHDLTRGLTRPGQFRLKVEFHETASRRCLEIT